MVSYSIIWPVSNIIQQTIRGKSWSDYDWAEVARFGIYGGFYVAPTLFSWVKIASVMWPKSNFQSAVKKAFIETITYTPFAMVSFYFGMSLLESKTLSEAIEEVKIKFLPTYKVGALVWPTVATINFCVIPEKNRVPFISICSLIWTSFLAYMKHLEAKEIEALETKKNNIPTVHISNSTLLS